MMTPAVVDSPEVSSYCLIPHCLQAIANKKAHDIALTLFETIAHWICMVLWCSYACFYREKANQIEALGTRHQIGNVFLFDRTAEKVAGVANEWITLKNIPLSFAKRRWEELTPIAKSFGTEHFTNYVTVKNDPASDDCYIITEHKTLRSGEEEAEIHEWIVNTSREFDEVTANDSHTYLFPKGTPRDLGLVSITEKTVYLAPIPKEPGGCTKEGISHRFGIVTFYDQTENQVASTSLDTLSRPHLCINKVQVAFVSAEDPFVRIVDMTDIFSPQAYTDFLILRDDPEKKEHYILTDVPLQRPEAESPTIDIWDIWKIDTTEELYAGALMKLSESFLFTENDPRRNLIPVYRAISGKEEIS